MADDRREADLILPPGVFAFVQDDTIGNVNVYSGPIKRSLSGTDKLVIMDKESGRFRPARQDEAVQSFVLAHTGYYVVLRNPARDGKQPISGEKQLLALTNMKMGQVENLSGPQCFPLWPGQTATVVRGHHLHSNQYLMVRVYDEKAAKVNWNQGVVKLATPIVEAPADDNSKQPRLEEMLDGGEKLKAVADTYREMRQPSAPPPPVSDNTPRFGIDPATLFTGQVFTIQGNAVSFYMPPTGIEVLPEREVFEDDGERATPATKDPYIRDAVTLERLEFCILLGENGNKRYVQGPEVVFPSPTEQFVVKENKRKFQAYELSPISGLHIKVIAAYEEDGEKFGAGKELFITGTQQAIYYPRQEHAIIKYGDQEKYYAITIPSGEARYVLNRETGDIRLVEGPAMFLPNPIIEVVAQRVLSDTECMLLYPGNELVRAFNKALRDRSQNPGSQPGGVADAFPATAAASEPIIRSLMASSTYTTRTRETAGRSVAGDQVNRGTTYNPPRTLVLAESLQGAVKVNVFTGYAVQRVNRKGDRKTVEGPQTVLLNFDEYLERMSLSTGTPKNQDQVFPTVYLKTGSNTVSDKIVVKTKDGVDVEMHIKYLVRFEGDNSKWFNIDNYVQYLVDHMRSLIGNHVRSLGLQAFHANAANILRDLVLGPKTNLPRPLCHFDENNMTIYDLELIGIAIKDAAINKLLIDAQQETLRNAILLDTQVRALELVMGQEDAKRKTAGEHNATAELQLTLRSKIAELEHTIAADAATREQELRAAQAESDKVLADLGLEAAKIETETERTKAGQRDEVAEATQKRALALLSAQSEAQKAVAEAFSPQITAALTTLGQVQLFASAAEHLAPLALVRGTSLAGTLEHVLVGTPLEKILQNLQTLGPIDNTR